MKTIGAILFVVLYGIMVSCGQISYPDSAVTKYDSESTNLLINEINYYRSWHGKLPCILSTRLSSHSYKWCRYIMNKHISEYDNFYKHSTFAPTDSTDLVLPNGVAELIHLVYWDHRPSSIEIVSSLMYGVNRGDHSIIGWKQSSSHNIVMLGNYSYFGAAVFIAKRDKWWVCYGVVNYSTSN